MASMVVLPAAVSTLTLSRKRTHLSAAPSTRLLPPSRSSKFPHSPPPPTLSPPKTIPNRAPHVASPTTISPPTPPQSEADPSTAPPSLTRTLLLCASIWVAASVASYVLCGASRAADDSIRASGLGLKVATALRRSGWADEAVVLALATLPVLELRGAIPVGYWMHLDPLLLTILSILGNMVPVPFIILYLKRFASFHSRKSPPATRFLDLLFERAREKAGPVEEFRWLGLMLFVAVPFPGTGAWTGAIIASILDMPFWSAVSANFFGVVLAGLLVNLLVNLGLKYAVATGLLLFIVSTVMWSVLRHFKKPLSSK